MKLTKAMARQMETERAELAAFVELPNASPVGYAWCGAHDCRPGTCFPLHHPEAFRPRRKVRWR